MKEHNITHQEIKEGLETVEQWQLMDTLIDLLSGFISFAAICAGTFAIFYFLAIAVLDQGAF